MKLVKTILLSSITLGTVGGVMITTITPTTASAGWLGKLGRILKVVGEALTGLGQILDKIDPEKPAQAKSQINVEGLKQWGSDYNATINGTETMVTFAKDVLVYEKNSLGYDVYIKAGKYQLDSEGFAVLTYIAK